MLGAEVQREVERGPRRAPAATTGLRAAHSAPPERDTHIFYHELEEDGCVAVRMHASLSLYMNQNG